MQFLFRWLQLSSLEPSKFPVFPLVWSVSLQSHGKQFSLLLTSPNLLLRLTSALNSAEQSWVKHPVRYLEEAKESSSLEIEWGNVNAYFSHFWILLHFNSLILVTSSIMIVIEQYTPPKNVIRILNVIMHIKHFTIVT